MEYQDPGRYIPIIYLLYSWGSRFGVPSRVPLSQVQLNKTTAADFPADFGARCEAPGLGVGGV